MTLTVINENNAVHSPISLEEIRSILWEGAKEVPGGWLAKLRVGIKADMVQWAAGVDVEAATRARLVCLPQRCDFTR